METTWDKRVALDVIGTEIYRLLKTSLDLGILRPTHSDNSCGLLPERESDRLGGFGVIRHIEWDAH